MATSVGSSSLAVAVALPVESASGELSRTLAFLLGVLFLDEAALPPPSAPLLAARSFLALPMMAEELDGAGGVPASNNSNFSIILRFFSVVYLYEISMNIQYLLCVCFVLWYCTYSTSSNRTTVQLQNTVLCSKVSTMIKSQKNMSLITI